MGKNKNKIKIPPPNDGGQEKLKFSFEYYDTIKDKYCLSKWGEEKTCEALKRLKEINAKTLNDLFRQRNTYHFHDVDWKKTEDKEGFPYEPVNNLPPYQFGLIGVNSGKARVFGGLSGNIFYVVWFDMEHKIDPTPLQHT